jgi:hypothetical protein
MRRTHGRTFTAALTLLGAAVSGAVRAVVSWLLQEGAEG